MRPVILTDVTAASRSLLTAERSRWRPLLRDVLARAENADRHRLDTRSVHPEWGNGSLHDALHGLPRACEPSLSDPHYIDALIAVLAALRGHLTGQA